MNREMTRDELAEFFGISTCLVDEWATSGKIYALPDDQGEPPAARRPFDWHVSRRDLAKLFQVHPDSITRMLTQGLKAAVLEPGGRGKELIFDLRLAWKFWLAEHGQLDALVKEDFRACSERGRLAIEHLPIHPIVRAAFTPEKQPTKRTITKGATK